MPLNKEHLVVGQKVKLTSNNWIDSDVNPIWGGRLGHIEGVITNTIGTLLPINVSWSNGAVNSYDIEDLDILTTQPIQPIVNTLSIKDAVISVINSQFVSKQAPFSGYDVTSAVRKQVNDGLIRLDGVPFETINGKSTQRVTHDDVRSFVRDFMNSVASYDRKFNGDYIVYSFNGHSVAPAPVASSPTVRPSLTFTPAGAQTSTPVTQPSSDLTGKIVTYIGNKQVASLKQIQSRLKGEPVTVRDIAGLVTKAGLRIDVKTPYHASVVTK